MRLLFALLLVSSSALAQTHYFKYTELSEGFDYDPHINSGYNDRTNQFADQWFESFKFVSGTVIYNGRAYTALLNFDIVKDEIVYIRSDGKVLNLPNTGITQMIIPGHVFICVFKPLQPGRNIYEKIGDYYVLHQKRVMPEQYVNGGLHDIITEEKDRYFQLVDGQLKKVKHPKL